MKKTHLLLLLLAITVAGRQAARAQGNASDFLKTGLGDGQKLAGAYLKPLLDGFACSMNNGWYNTARHHGLGGFDLTFTMSITQVDNSMKTFDASTLGLNTDVSKPRMVLANPSGSSVTSTLYGPETGTATVNVLQRFNGKDTVIAAFSMPPGINVPIGVGLPNLQGALGIGFGTEVLIRVSPQFKFQTFKVSSFGFGAKHNLSHWIWKREKKPIDIALVGGFSTLSASYALGDDYLQPQSNVEGGLPPDDYKSSQQFTFSGSGYMGGLVLSKKVLFITFYAGATYSHATVDMVMAGKYPATFVETDFNSPNFGKPVIVNFTDPIKLHSELNYMRLNGGIRLKLGFITVHGEYVTGPVTTYSAGLGVNIQSLRPFSL